MKVILSSCQYYHLNLHHLLLCPQSFSSRPPKIALQHKIRFTHSHTNSQTQIRKHERKTEDMNANQKTRMQIIRHERKSENTNEKQKTWTQIRKHERKSENTNANQKTRTQIKRHKPKSENTMQIRKHEHNQVLVLKLMVYSPRCKSI